MRLKKPCAATLATFFLPGFEIDSDVSSAESLVNTTSIFELDPNQNVNSDLPVEVLDQIKTSSKAVKKKLWQVLDASHWDALSGDVTKFEANLNALALLPGIESGNRAVTESERIALNMYTGWGGLAKVFSDTSDEKWLERGRKLETYLSPEQMRSAEDSTLNSHYTPPDVIQKIWKLVQRLGFDGGKILDPSAGTGYFIGQMPEALAKKSTIHAVEPDVTSARILRALYARHDVFVHECGLESTTFPEHFFDLVISNVPFGNYKVPELRNVPFADYLIHDYFFAKSFELARPGGLIALITSSGTMDKMSSNVRQYLNGQGKLVGAIRLPSTTFQQLGNTSVVADILIMQKWTAGECRDDATPWVECERPDSKFGYMPAGMYINRYWNANPQMILGKLSMRSSAYGPVLDCMAQSDAPLSDLLDECVVAFPEKLYKPRKDEASKGPAAVVLNVEPNSRAGFLVVNGVVFESDGFNAVEVKNNAKMLDRISMLCAVRDAARVLIKAQISSSSDDHLVMYRVALDVAYSKFVEKHGFIHESMNMRAFKSDPDFPLLLSLEIWDSTKKVATKADIFNRRTVMQYQKVERCDTLTDALVVSVVETGQVNPERIASLLGRDQADVMTDLEHDGLVYLDPDGAIWRTADEYLSGDVKTKLRLAKLSGERYQVNVSSLEKIIPADLQPSDIGVRIGSTWVPGRFYSDFLNSELSAKDAKVTFSQSVGTWAVEVSGSALYGMIATQTYGTNRINAFELFEKSLNLQVPEIKDKHFDRYIVNRDETIAAREKQAALQERFKQWLWEDASRSEVLIRIYNDTYNCIVPRQYDGMHMPLPGFSHVVNLHTHQRNSIWRIVSSGGNTLLGHAVGAGKTFVMICAGMELRRLGKASKPMYIVPNHMLYNFAAEFMRAYPSANILMASKDDLGGNRRRAFLSRIATGSWDAILLTHSTFEKIPMSPDVMETFIQEEIDKIEWEIKSQGRSGNSIVKELARSRKSWEARLKKLEGKERKDDVLHFEDLGVDYLLLDECHIFKNCFRHTKMNRVAGLPNSNSERAFDLLTKSRYVMEKRGGDSGLCFATATFVSNSMAEMWVFQRYLQPRRLKQMGLDMFDSWASNFGEVVTALELAPDGRGYRMQTRFAKFVNLPDLMSVFSEVADIKTPEMLNLPTPTVIHHNCVVPATEKLTAFVEKLVARAEKIRSGGVEPSVDNMLSVTGDGRNAALDLRLVGIPVDDGDIQKVDVAAENISRIWSETSIQRSTQLVFCDAGTPGGNARYNLYEELRRQLVLRGVAASEVAFIHEHDGSDASKDALFAKVRAGHVRVLIGSTSKCGVGTNIQTKLVALHHMDAPWRPADLEQRDGRIVRQGNENEIVNIYRYVTEKSFDSYVWQLLHTKAKFIAQVMSGDSSVRTMEDVSLSTLSFAELKALASGNPLVLEKAGVDADLAKLTVMHSNWKRNNWQNRRTLVEAPKWIENLERRKANQEIDHAMWLNNRDKPFSAMINGTQYFDCHEAGRAVRESPFSGEKINIGHWQGFALFLVNSLNGKSIRLVGRSVYETKLQRSFDQVFSALSSRLDGIEQDVADTVVEIERNKKELRDVRAALDQPFEHEDRLRYLIQRQRELESELDLNQSEMQVVDDTAEVEVVEEVELAEAV